MITTVTLNPTIDICVPLKKFVPGTVSRTDSVFSYPGGKGTNVARALAVLGCKVTAAGFCGDADIVSMEAFMKINGVSPAFTRVHGENRLCVLLSESSVPRESVINSESAFSVKRGDTALFLRELAALAKRSQYVIISGSLPRGLAPGFYAECVRAASKHAPVMLDTSSSGLRKALPSGPWAIKQNSSELAAALNRKLATKPDIRRAMRLVSEKYGIDTVIVTLGSKGAVLYKGGKFWFSPAVKSSKRVSPVGSGDAFAAGYVYALSKKKSPPEALRWAVAAAAANAGKPGSCFFGMSSVVSCYRRSRVSPSW